MDKRFTYNLQDFSFPVPVKTSTLTDQARLVKLSECQKMAGVILEERIKVKQERHILRYGMYKKTSLNPEQLARYANALDEIIKDWDDKFEAWKKQERRLTK